MYIDFNQRVMALGQSLCPVTSRSLPRSPGLPRLSSLLPNQSDHNDRFDRFCASMCFPRLGNQS